MGAVTSASYRQYARSAPDHFGVLQVLSGLARGCWKGIYAWFLYDVLALRAGDVAVILGAQFVLQILLEIPSGLHADRSRRGGMLTAAYLLFALYSLLYLLPALEIARTDGQPLARGLAFTLALMAEIAFGVASAFFSGTLDAWMADLESQMAGPDRDRFSRRLKVVSGMKFVSGTLSRALVGVTVYWLTVYRHPDVIFVGWLAAMLLYGAAAYYAWATVAEPEARFEHELRTAARDKRPRRDVLDDVSRASYRALSYLAETPGVLRVFAQTALVYVVFYASQAYWLVFFRDSLGGRRDTLSVLPQVPLFLLIWGAGEFAEAAGSSSTRRVQDRFESRSSGKSRAHNATIVVYLAGYLAAIATQIASLALEPQQGLALFGVAFVFGRLVEGGLRRQIDELTNLVIVSERATLQSIDALTKAVFGLIVVGLVGSVTSVAPVNGLVVMFLTVCAALLAFVLVPIDIATIGLPPDRRARRASDPPARRRPPRALATTVLLVAPIAVLALVLGLRRVDQGPQLGFWRKLTRHEPVTAALLVVRPSTDPQRADGYQRWALSTPRRHIRGGQSASCRVTVEPPQLRNSSVAGSREQKLAVDGRGITVSFELGPDRSDASQLSAFPTVGHAGELRWTCEVGDGHGIARPLAVVTRSGSASDSDAGAALGLAGEIGVAMIAVVALFVLGQMYATRVRRRSESNMRRAAATFRDFAHHGVNDLHPGTALAGLTSTARRRLDLHDQPLFGELDGDALMVGAIEVWRFERGAFNAWHHALRTPSADGPAASAWIAGYLTRLGRLDDGQHGEEAAATFELTEIAATTAKSAPDDWPIRYWTRDAANANSIPPGAPASTDLNGWFISWVAVVDEGDDRRTIAFAAAIERERGVRYADPLHRALLGQLADIALLQHHAAKLRIRNFDHWHDVNRGLDRVQQLAERFTSQTDRRLDPALLQNVIAVEVKHIDALLNPNSHHDQSIPLREELETIAKGVSENAYLDPHELDVPVSGVTVAWSGEPDAWISGAMAVDLRLIVRELLRNAQKHGEPRDMIIWLTLDVRASGSSARFIARTPLAPKPARASATPSGMIAQRSGPTGFGLFGLRYKVERHGGRWVRREIDGDDFVVEFVLPTLVTPEAP